MILYVLAICFISFILWVLHLAIFDDAYFNPKSNYEKWYDLNWFGVLFLTVLYWVIFLPVSVVVGIGWVVYKLFTFGRT